jgi:PBP1b-binding outer membrane lipoprotein LpoB
MRQIKNFFGAAILCIVIFSGCQKEATNSSLNAANSQGKSSSVNTIVLKAKLEKMIASMPAGYEQRLTDAEKRYFKQHPEFRALVQRAVVPTICNDYTTHISMARRTACRLGQYRIFLRSCFRDVRLPNL